VEAFGVNGLVLPAGYETGRHFHERQQELYFVHRGTVEIEFDDGVRQRLGPGGLARVDAATVRRLRNVGDEEATLLITGGANGYVGRDGRAPDPDDPRFGPSSPPVA
jgi:mannose-6-phosphate isomerase-like protein (cupin superfamily)